MVGSWTLAFDVASVAVSTAIPGIAWTLLFLLAWRRPSFAASLGLGTRTFWLLLPGALLASFALLPVTPVYGDLIAVSVAGAGFPLAVGVLTLDRITPPFRRSAVRLFGPLVVEIGALLAVVLLADAGRLSGLARSVGSGVWPIELGLVVIVAAVFIAGVVAGYGRRTQPAGSREIGGIFGLTSAVLVLTFAGSQAIPGVGISEAFPYFLLPPVFAGLVAVLLADRLFPGQEAFALPAAFLASSWGVVLGADILWQPPLYTPGSAGLYAIGGAGVLDLVYLSGFLGLLGAWGAHRLAGRSLRPVGSPLPPNPPSPSLRLREAYAYGIEGALGRSLVASASAARSAGFQAQRLLGRTPTNASRPWDGLAVPGWVVSDQANLDGIARAGTSEPREASRAYVTARALVQLGEALGRPRFASIGQRLVAFVIDLVVLGAAGAAVLAAIVVATPGDLTDLLGSVGVNAAIYGFVGASLLYFALGELWTGATVGKRLMRIEVRDRGLGPVGGVAAFLRNTPLMPAMTLCAIGLALGVTIGLRGLGAGASLGGVSALAGAAAIVSLALVVVAGVAFAGAVGVATMAATSERQRVGDLWAGTWVVRRLSATTVPPGAAGRAAPSE